MRCNSTALALHTPQRGFSMLEILITLVIIATALLGTAGLQMYAMRMGQSGQLRTQAVFLASDMAERMEANKSAATSGFYALTLTSTPGVAIADCGTLACNSASLALWDLSQWGTTIGSLLPQSSWEITQTTTGNPSTYSIVIHWTDRRTDTNYAAFNSSNSLGINAAGTGERFSYTATRTVKN